MGLSRAGRCRVVKAPYWGVPDGANGQCQYPPKPLMVEGMYNVEKREQKAWKHSMGTSGHDFGPASAVAFLFRVA